MASGHAADVSAPEEAVESGKPVVHETDRTMKPGKTMLHAMALLAAIAMTTPGGALAGDADASARQTNETLAKKLANPIADLVSLPFQLNYDGNIGPDDNGSRWLLNVQPVIPFKVNPDLTIISRTIMPVVFQDQLYPGAGYQSGLGDTVQSFFFSPKLEDQSLTVGAGPVIQLPTATDDLLGSDQWGAGPTFVVVKLSGPWTYGVLANHIWSFAGDNDRPDINTTFFQPFVANTTPAAWTFSLTSESTYDWESRDTAIPFNVMVTKLIQIGNQRVSIGSGVRYWAKSSDNGAEGLGFRAIVTLLFPK